MTTPPPDLPRLVAQFRAALLQREAEAARRMAAAYADLWRAVRDELTQADLTQRGRLEALQAAIAQRLLVFAALAEQEITTAQQQAVALAQNDAGQLLRAAVGEIPPGIPLRIVTVPDGALTALVGALGDGSPLHDLLLSIAPATADAAGQLLAQGVALGTGPRETARQLRDVLGVSLTRALTISRTETLRAYREASLANYRANGDVVKEWQWSSQLSTRTCPVCWAMHGRVFPLSEPFGSHPNCFVPGTVVDTPQVLGSTKRWYDGEVIDIRTASGQVITCTPNHPILTPQGWVAAGLLHEGGYVISSLDSQRVIAEVDPHNDHVPAVIEQIADTFGGSLGVSTVPMPTAPEDFHGDGEGSQVHVVRTNGLLWNAVDPAILQPFPQEQFIRGRVRLPNLAGFSALHFLLKGMLSTTRCLMCGGGQRPVLLGGAFGGHQSIGVNLTSAQYARLIKSQANDITAYAKRFSNSVLGLARKIAVDNFLGRQVKPTDGAGLQAFGLSTIPSSLITEEATLLENAAKTLLAGTKTSSNALATLTSNIRLNRVLKVDKRKWAGHVYNLQTVTGWYIANTIITHNCRCVPIPKTRSWAELGYPGIPDTRPVVPLGTDVFATLPETDQRAILGPGKLAAYQAGTLQLTDLVGVRDDPRWGRVRYERSLESIG